MLNVGLTLKAVGNSSLYALSLIFSNTLKGPSALGSNLDFLNSGKRSFLKCNQTRSPGSKVTCFRPLLPASLYFSFIASMIALVVSYNFNISSARCVASRFNFSEGGIGNKSMGARGTKPYTISKGHNLVVECRAIICKLNMRQAFFPHLNVMFQNSPKHGRQRPINNFCLPISLRMISSRKQKFSLHFGP